MAATALTELARPGTQPGTHSDTKLPRVLVLLASYNGARWIRAQLRSILAQQQVQVRVVVRDDGSTDNTPMELARFGHEGRIKVVHALRPSGSAAANFMALIAENTAGEHDFVAFADQDDVWHSDKLTNACRCLRNNCAAGYSSATIAAWPDGRESLVNPSGKPTRSDFLFEGAGQGCTFVLTAALYERVRHFLADHCNLTQHLHYHDWMTYALARAWELSWHFDATPSMHYRQHAGNDTGARGTLGGIGRRLALIRDGFYGRQLRVIAELCHAAAPANQLVAAWCGDLQRSPSWSRRLSMATFCIRGGRRRSRDNFMAALAALSGWI